ncbi:hypothetical protein M8C21_020280, partial [Ambrosia artemisiifolia]
ALIALKKGAHLLKYGRKGKPKFCPFRLSHGLILWFISTRKYAQLIRELLLVSSAEIALCSFPSCHLTFANGWNLNPQDESSLIWISDSGERSLKLASVSRIIPGQRTAVFRRYLRPEKDYLSFSLIYNNGKRSLDLICKDKVEAEVWIAGLKALISSLQEGRLKIDGWSDEGLYLDDNRDLASNSASDSSISAPRDFSSPDISISSNPTTSPKSHPPGLERSYAAALDQTNMQLKGSSSDAFRVSISSAPSTSSHGSGLDDSDSLGDVYIWGEVICDNVVKLGPDQNVNLSSTRTDVLLPRPLESNLVLDVSHIACGVRHAALVTRQGELFTWGEEFGGRLGHGVGKDESQPRLVESLAVSNIDFVACGEFHTCAVTSSGEMYTWGDGTHNIGLLGHGTDVSQWIPKRISGPLEGLQVASVACGPWHTALITSTGQLFTFGDGTFGVLGHGNHENVSYPKEVESLSGLRTVAVACGVWHTAAVVDVIVAQSSPSVLSGKLFTWGDGVNNRLGHGDEESRLKPTCVPALIDYNFHKVACGHSLTVGLTTSGHAFGFTRKRHNCYNCGLVHCHSCSSKKAPRAALAPNPGKPYRVCDSCYTKLSKMAETRITNRQNVKPRLSGENKDKLDKAELKLAKSGTPSNQDLIQLLDNKAAKQGKKGDAFLGQSTQGPSLMQLKDVMLLGDFLQAIPKSINIPSGITSRSVSPISRNPSPPRSGTHVPTTSGLSFSKGFVDSLKKTNELLNQEVLKLRGQVDILKRQCSIQECELQKSRKAAQEAMVLAAEESAKFKASQDVIKSLAAKLKDKAESTKSENGLEQNGVIQYAYVNGDDTLLSNVSLGPTETISRTEEPMQYDSSSPKSRTSNKNNECLNGVGVQLGSNNYVESKDYSPPHDEDNNFEPRSPVSSVGTPATTTNHVEAEWSAVQLRWAEFENRTGTVELVNKRTNPISRRRFGEQQAETWLSENCEKVCERYNVIGSN